jgi:hypothetical protein
MEKARGDEGEPIEFDEEDESMYELEDSVICCWLVFLLKNLFVLLARFVIRLFPPPPPPPLFVIVLLLRVDVVIEEGGVVCWAL